MLVATQPYQKQLGNNEAINHYKAQRPIISYTSHPIRMGVYDIKQTPLSETPKSHNPLLITTK